MTAKRLDNGEDRLLDEEKHHIMSQLSYVFFADEQDTKESLLFGGYLVQRDKLKFLDEAVQAAKQDAGLPAEVPVKASPPKKDSFAAIRGLGREQRARLREAMLAILEKVDATCIFSMVWKYDPAVSPDAYQWAFNNVLQRLSITVERRVRQAVTVGYPALDVVVDWFPNPDRCRKYFATYHEAYYQGYDFAHLGKNKLQPLKHFHACPCLFVTSCEFSPALQVADYCVSAVGELLRWACTRNQRPSDVPSWVEPVVRHLLRVNGKIIGFGLVLPTKGQMRAKVQSALNELGLA